LYTSLHTVLRILQ